jgi:hypothetical protein
MIIALWGSRSAHFQLANVRYAVCLPDIDMHAAKPFYVLVHRVVLQAPRLRFRYALSGKQASSRVGGQCGLMRNPGCMARWYGTSRGWNSVIQTDARHDRQVSRSVRQVVQQRSRL